MIYSHKNLISQTQSISISITKLNCENTSIFQNIIEGPKSKKKEEYEKDYDEDFEDAELTALWARIQAVADAKGKTNAGFDIDTDSLGNDGTTNKQVYKSSAVDT